MLLFFNGIDVFKQWNKFQKKSSETENEFIFFTTIDKQVWQLILRYFVGMDEGAKERTPK